MAEWMYMYSLPLDMHPHGCKCDGCLSYAYGVNGEVDDQDFEFFEPTESEINTLPSSDDRSDDGNLPDYEIPSPREPGVRYWDEIGLDD